MSTFVDTSALVSYLVADTQSERVIGWFANSSGETCVSRWAIAEFSSALAALRRAGSLSAAARRAAELALDQWLGAGVGVVDLTPGDFELARLFVRTDRIVAKAPDALHLAVALRHGADVLCLDTQMRRAARALGLAVAP